jgi:hypothetical protein
VTGGLSREEQLLVTLTSLSDERPGRLAHDTIEVAGRLGWSPDEVDLAARELERRHLVTRRSAMDGKAWAYAVGATDEGFLWRQRHAPGWKAFQAAAEEWLVAAGRGSPVNSADLADVAGMHPRAAAALVLEGDVSGAVRNARQSARCNVRAISIGLRP